jgi:protein phosphatase
MASTLTFLYLSENPTQALIGWIGDSRVYHIRNGKILFKTKDHSEVQRLIDLGELTVEEATHYKRKNVITRAVSGREPSRIDQHIVEDIKENDFFLLCTDGILENLTDKEINNWFTPEATPEDLRSLILDSAMGNTKDNFSMFLVKIKEVLHNGKNTKSMIRRIIPWLRRYP